MMIMVQLLIIPVYAFSEKVLKNKYIEYVKSFRKKSDAVSEENLQGIIDHETYPQRSTLLNHVIGYITISVYGNDIYFDVYLPLELKRYVWTSKQRSFIQNISANGTHFNYTLCHDNTEIQKKVLEMTDLVIKEHVPHRFFVDSQAFFRLNNNMDYIKLIQTATE